MKKLFCLFLVGLLPLIGCATRPTAPGETPQAVNDIATAAELAAYTATTYHLIDHPDARPQFENVRAVLASLVATNNFDPIAFTSALQKLPLKEIKGEKGALIVNGAIILWQAYGQRVVHLDRAVYVKPVLEHTLAGFNRALDPK